MQYQLNGDIEYHNAAEPSTTLCPFLPGQIVNILEVPIQVQDVTHGRCDSSSSIGSVHYTLNPEDKYLDLKPRAAPRLYNSKVTVQSTWNTTAVQKRQKTDTGTLLQASCPTTTPDLLTTQIWSRLISRGQKPSTGPEPSSRYTTSASNIRCLRRAQSVRTIGCPKNKTDRPLSCAGSCPEVQRSRSHCGAIFRASELLYPLKSNIDDVGGYGKTFENRLSTSPSTNIGAHLSNGPVPEFDRILQYPERSSEASYPLVCSAHGENRTPTSSRSYPTDVTAADLFAHDEPNYGPSMDASESVDPTGIIVDLYAELDDTVQSQGHHAESPSSSARLSESFSPSLTSSTAYSGCMSPLHMGQPNTPETTEFEEYFLPLDHDTQLRQENNPEIQIDSIRPDTAYIDRAGISGYNLTEAEHGSSLTIQQCLAPNDAKSGANHTACKSTSNQDRVTSWNDGSLALEELFNELSYLGEIIT